MYSQPGDLCLLHTDSEKLATTDKYGVEGLPLATYSRLVVEGPAQFGAARIFWYTSPAMSDYAPAFSALRAVLPTAVGSSRPLMVSNDVQIAATAFRWQLLGHPAHAEGLRNCIEKLVVCRVYDVAGAPFGGTVRLHYGWWDEPPENGGVLIDACTKHIDIDVNNAVDFKLTLERPDDSDLIDGHISWLKEFDTPLYLCAYLGEPSTRPPVTLSLLSLSGL